MTMEQFFWLRKKQEGVGRFPKEAKQWADIEKLRVYQKQSDKGSRGRDLSARSYRETGIQ